MYKKIIISLALDHGISEKALEAARKLRADASNIVAVHVYEPISGTAAAYVSQEDVAKSFQAATDKLAERVAEAPDVKAVMLKGHTARALIDYAEKVGADCIIVGSHKPGVSDFFLGSTAARIVRHAPCTVIVLR